MPRATPNKPSSGATDERRRQALATLTATNAALAEINEERHRLKEEITGWVEVGERTLRILQDLTRQGEEAAGGGAEPEEFSLTLEACENRCNLAARKADRAETAFHELGGRARPLAQRRDALRVELGVDRACGELLVSAHAMLRFLERARGLDVESCRRYLGNPGLKRSVEQWGDGIHFVDRETGLRALVKDGLLRTVYAPEGAELAPDPQRPENANAAKGPFAALAGAVKVSDPAVVRYLEVSLGIDFAPIRQLLASESIIRRVDVLGDGLYPLGGELGLHVRVVRRRVVTIHKLDPKRLSDRIERVFYKRNRGAPSARPTAARGARGADAWDEEFDADAEMEADMPGFRDECAERYAEEGSA